MLIRKKKNAKIIAHISKCAAGASLVTMLAACGGEPNVVNNDGSVNTPVPAPIPMPTAPEAAEPVSETPNNQGPVTQPPLINPPVIQEPVTQEPVTQEPVTQEPVTQEPVTQEPVTQEPVTQEPVTQEPVTQEPVTQEPVTQEPVTQEPVTQEPVTQEPTSATQNILTSDGTFALGQQNFVSFFNDEAQPGSIDWMNEASVDIGSLSSMVWHVQLQHPVSVIKDTLYTVCADVSAETARTFEFVIDSNADDGFKSLNSIAIGAEANAVIEMADTQPQTFQYTFYANTTDETARVVFSLGTSDVNMTFDNIGMYEGEQCGNPSNLKPVADTSLVIADIPSAGRVDCPAPPPAEIDKRAPGIPGLAINENQLKTRFETQTPFAASSWTIPWDMFEPSAAANNSANEKFPLLVVLHGGYGSEGADGNVTRDVLRYAMGSQDNGLLTDANLNRFPSYVIAPHCRMSAAAAPVVVNGQAVDQPLCAFGTNEWASGGGAANFTPQNDPSLAGGAVIELIEHMIQTRDVDPSRIYLTGNSMGGGGTWDLLTRRPDLFAAALPVSGHTPNPDYFKAIADSKIPVWAFAGKSDFTNPITDTRAAAQSIADQGGCFYYTEYENAAHDDILWSGPYLEDSIWTWLFDQSLPQDNATPTDSGSSVPNQGVSADYEAPKTNRAPVIDGTAEALWDAAPWEAIDTPWLFDSLTVPSSAADFSGRYKAVWDANKLYVLVEITDDKVIDWNAEPTRLYWRDDTVEIFIDEDKSGGPHRGRATPGDLDANAFAYHLSTLGDNVDTFDEVRTVFGDDHIEYKRVEVTPTKSVWEMAITVWGDDYILNGNSTPVTLTEGKIMGFTMSYIDTDGNQEKNREHFIGSIDSPGHQNNEGFKTADGFGSLKLVK